MPNQIQYLKVTIEQDSTEDEFYIEIRGEYVRVTVKDDQFKTKKLRKLPPGSYRWEWRGFNEPDIIWLNRVMKEEVADDINHLLVDRIPDMYVSYAEQAFRKRFPKVVPGKLNIFQAVNNMLERVRVTKRWRSYAVLQENVYTDKLGEFITKYCPVDQWCVENGQIWVSREFISQYVFLGEKGAMTQIVRRDSVKPLPQP